MYDIFKHVQLIEEENKIKPYIYEIQFPKVKGYVNNIGMTLLAFSDEAALNTARKTFKYMELEKVCFNDDVVIVSRN